MINVGFVCPTVDDSDVRVLAPVFLAAGITLSPVLLSSWSPELHEYHAMILKGDESKTTEGFLNGVKLSVEYAGSSFFNNPLGVVAWASDKSNFFRYQQRGVSTQDVLRFEKPDDAIAFLRSATGEHIVFNGDDTQQYVNLDDGSDVEVVEVVRSLRNGAAPIYLKKDVRRVMQGGWTSFYFFGGRVSHAVKYTLHKNESSKLITKRASRVSPSERMVSAASYVAATTDDLLAESDVAFSMGDTLYARFDFLPDDEPVLYDWSFFNTDLNFSLHPQASTRFLNAFLSLRQFARR